MTPTNRSDNRRPVMTVSRLASRLARSPEARHVLAEWDRHDRAGDVTAATDARVALCDLVAEMEWDVDRYVMSVPSSDTMRELLATGRKEQ